MSGKTRKILGSLVVVGVLGGLVGLGAFSAFTATTTNSGNSISSGTVKIDQDDAATLFIRHATEAGRGQRRDEVRRRHVHRLAELDVYLYGTNVASPTAPSTQVTVERGANSSAPADQHAPCAGFTVLIDCVRAG